MISSRFESITFNLILCKIKASKPGMRQISLISQFIKFPQIFRHKLSQIIWKGWFDSTDYLECYPRKDVEINQSTTNPRWAPRLGLFPCTGVSHGKLLRVLVCLATTPKQGWESGKINISYCHTKANISNISNIFQRICLSVCGVHSSH